MKEEGIKKYVFVHLIIDDCCVMNPDLEGVIIFLQTLQMIIVKKLFQNGNNKPFNALWALIKCSHLTYLHFISFNNIVCLISVHALHHLLLISSFFCIINSTENKFLICEQNCFNYLFTIVIFFVFNLNANWSLRHSINSQCS